MLCSADEAVVTACVRVVVCAVTALCGGGIGSAVGLATLDGFVLSTSLSECTVVTCVARLDEDASAVEVGVISVVA